MGDIVSGEGGGMGLCHGGFDDGSAKCGCLFLCGETVFVVGEGYVVLNYVVLQRCLLFLGLSQGWHRTLQR